jgi:hypothetical protein
MDRDTTGAISCTFTANIVAGQTSQLTYNSSNTTVIGLVCDGLQFAAVQTPSMLLNQPWYWNPQTWSTAGTQSCGIAAHNSLGEVAVVMFDLVVAPVGQTPSGGGADGQASYPPGDPRNPPPTGSSSRSGQPAGYYNPVTGLTYSDPAGTQVCGNCTTDTSTQVNVGLPGDVDNPGGSSTNTGVGQ